MILLFLTFMIEVFTIIVQRIFSERIMSSRGRSHISEIFAWLLYFIAYNFVTYVLSDNAWINMIAFAASFYILSLFLYKDSIRHKIYVLSLLYVAGMCSELIIYSMSYFIFNRLYSQNSVTEQQIFLIGSITSKLIWFCLLKFILLLTKKGRTFETSLLDWLEAVFIPLGSIVMFFVFLPVEGTFPEGDTTRSISKILGIAILLAINIVSYYLYEKGKETAEKRIYTEALKEQCNYYMRQCEESKALWMEFSKFRHDMKQKNIYLQTLLEAGKYNELKAYYKENMEFLSAKKGISNSGNIFFDSILNYKGEIAAKDGIKFYLAMEVPHDCKVNGEEISICLGNLLDNAIEAVKEVDEEKRDIHIRIKAQGNNLYIEVRNPYDKPRVKCGADYITTKSDVRSHGWGLQIVREIVEQHKGEMQISDKDGEFCVKLLLYQIIYYL